jgi:hypothetical protein
MWVTKSIDRAGRIEKELWQLGFDTQLHTSIIAEDKEGRGARNWLDRVSKGAFKGKWVSRTMLFAFMWAWIVRLIYAVLLFLLRIDP